MELGPTFRVGIGISISITCSKKWIVDQVSINQIILILLFLGDGGGGGGVFQMSLSTKQCQSLP